MKTSVFLGVGGAGMKGLAFLLRGSGETVFGFDDDSENTEISLEEARANLSRADQLIYTDAALETHPLRIVARQANIPELPYQKALGEFSKKYTTIAITGTHGKSSTTAFLAHICIEAGLDPSVLIGASMETLPGKHAKLGQGDYFIVEADEYRKHFLELTPAHIIITTIDFDHPDAFSSLQEVEKAYEEFMGKLSPDGTVTIPEHEKMTHPNMQFPKHVIAVQKQASNNIHVTLPGDHMKMNAALAVALAETLGVSRESAIRSLTTFPGLARRFELLGAYNNCDIRSDYGHHPTEITATLAGARKIYPTKHIVAVFEAHMPLRLKTFFNDFVDALSHADEIAIVQPFAPTGRSSSAQEDALRLQEELLRREKQAIFYKNNTDFLDSMKENSVAVLFSAGSLDLAVRKSVKKH